MKKKNKILSLMTAALMLTAVPSAGSADAAYTDEWLYFTPLFNSRGELEYESVLSRTYESDLTLPTEIDGVHIKGVDPIEFIGSWIRKNPKGRHLTVFVPEGMEILNTGNDGDLFPGSYLSDWPDGFTAEFILSNGMVLVYNKDYWESYYSYLENEFQPEDWEYETEIDENSEEYIKLLKYHGSKYIVEFPSEFYGIPVKAIGTHLFGDMERMVKMELKIPSSITQFDDDCFYGLHDSIFRYRGFEFVIEHDFDPETPDYLSIRSYSNDGNFESFKNECYQNSTTEYEDIQKLYDEMMFKQLFDTDDPFLRCERIANYPVLGVSIGKYSGNFSSLLPLPDSVRFIRQSSTQNCYTDRIHMPADLQILPSDFLNLQDYVLDVNSLDYSNIKYAPRDVYVGKEYSEDDSTFDNLDGKMLPEGISVDDPFMGFTLNDEEGRTFRIQMDKKDFNYYAHLIYEPYNKGGVPDEFMGFPVIDERSDAMYACSTYIVVPEDMKELGICSFIFDPIDFPQLRCKLLADNYNLYENAIKAKLKNTPLKYVEKIDVLSKDITVKQSLFYNSNIKEVTFPGSADIEKVAFSNSKLDTLTFTGTDSVIRLGENSFFHSTVTDISFPEKVKDLYLDNGAMCGIAAEEITLPDGTSHIGENCFSNCLSLKKITVNGSPEVSDIAFSGCAALEDITFTGKPTFGTNVFRNCKALKNINIDPDCLIGCDIFMTCPTIQTINGEAIFDKDGVLNKKFAKALESGLKVSKNSEIADKYVMYRVKKMVKETVNDNMTDMQKVKALHDKLCSMVEYDTGNEDDPKNHTDISVFLNESSVCEGYARAYNLLLNEAGIESCYVYNDSHAWNIVNIGGHYFHIDSTWDDGDVVEYTWYMKNDDEIRDDGSHATWEILAPSSLHSFQKSEMPVCTETMGDVNSDGVVDAVDASAVLSSYARASAGDKATADAVLGDVNFNGKVDAIDASEILTRYAAASVK